MIRATPALERAPYLMAHRRSAVAVRVGGHKKLAKSEFERTVRFGYWQPKGDSFLELKERQGWRGLYSVSRLRRSRRASRKAGWQRVKDLRARSEHTATER